MRCVYEFYRTPLLSTYSHYMLKNIAMFQIETFNGTLLVCFWVCNSFYNMQVTWKSVECMHSIKWTKRIIFIISIAQTNTCCCCGYGRCLSIESFELIGCCYCHFFRGWKYCIVLNVLNSQPSKCTRTHTHTVAKKWGTHLTGNKHKWQTFDILLTIIHHFINFDVAAH